MLRPNWLRRFRKHVPLFRQASSFIAVGLIQLGVEWFVFVALTFFALNLVAANIAARAIASLVGFYVNGRVTFRASVDGRALLRFVVVWTVLSVVDTTAIYVISALGGLPVAQLSKPVVDGLIAVLSFILARRWVFRSGLA